MRSTVARSITRRSMQAKPIPSPSSPHEEDRVAASSVEGEPGSSVPRSVGRKRRKGNPKPAVVTPPPQPTVSRRPKVSVTKRLVARKMTTEIPTNSPSSLVGSDESVDSSHASEVPIVGMPRSKEYLDLKVSREELRPSTTLTTGQCFHWKATVDSSLHKVSNSAWGSCSATEWIGVLPIPSETANSDGNSHAVVTVRETPTSTLYRALYLPKDMTQERVGCILRDYFQVDSTPSLKQLYLDWSAACPRLARIAQCIPGVRVVQQDPWECLVSFLCSSNNNIPRITKMLNSIRQTYGTPLATVSLPQLNGEDNGERVTFFSFPAFEDMRKRATEYDLRTKCGMGYRAKYLIKTINILHELGGEAYLKRLRTVNDPRTVQNELCQFHGVGPKVADCVALFSLDQVEAIPVDVHVWNVARRDYDEDGSLNKAKSLTPPIYNQVGELFRAKFEKKAGWAHSLLFVAELPSFKPLLPDDLIVEMDKFREAEKNKKKDTSDKTKKKRMASRKQ